MTREEIVAEGKPMTLDEIKERLERLKRENPEAYKILGEWLDFSGEYERSGE